jgi:ankyrin repeat protein
MTSVGSENSSSGSEERLLHNAVRRGKKQEVLTLLDEGEDVNGRGKFGMTSLHVAAEKGIKPEELLAHGANANVRDNCARTPLHCAAGGGMHRRRVS